MDSSTCLSDLLPSVNGFLLCSFLFCSGLFFCRCWFRLMDLEFRINTLSYIRLMGKMSFILGKRTEFLISCFGIFLIFQGYYLNNGNLICFYILLLFLSHCVHFSITITYDWFSFSESFVFCGVVIMESTGTCLPYHLFFMRIACNYDSVLCLQWTLPLAITGFDLDGLGIHFWHLVLYFID